MRNYVAIGIAVVTLLAFRPTNLVAQDTILAELYGQGVNAYFASQYQEAHEHFTTAIDLGEKIDGRAHDPRVFYFRGLACMSLGRPDDAKIDFQRGAKIEATGADRVYPVSQSLQRIQGRVRIEIERQRQTARLDARTRTVKATHARYEQFQSAEQQVLRNPDRPQPAPAKELVGTPPAEDETDPFGGPAQPIQPQVTAEPAATDEPADSDTNLFGDTAAEAMPADDSSGIFEADSETNPFTDDATPAADEDAPATEEAMPAEPEDDPFANPFG